MLADTISSAAIGFVVAPRPAALEPIAPTTEFLGKRISTGTLRTFEAKEHIYCEGDKATHVYVVEAGHVCIYKMLNDGRRQVIDFGYPGDIVGLADMKDHATSAQATSRTRVRCIPVSVLQQLAREDARLGMKLYEAISRELLATRELLFTVSQRTATERVASFILSLSRRADRNGESPDEFVLPMTRSDIADFLGLTIETVSRTFTKLRNEGLIDVSQCVLVAIRDMNRLTAFAEGRTG